MRPRINYLAVLASAVVYMIIGAAWYGIFKDPWMSMVGKSEAELMAGNMVVRYGVAFITDLMIGVLLSIILPKLGARTFMDGARYAFLLSFVFVFATGMTTYGFSARPMQLSLIDHLYHVLCITIAGGIIAAWKPSPGKAPMSARA